MMLFTYDIAPMLGIIGLMAPEIIVYENIIEAAILWHSDSQIVTL